MKHQYGLSNDSELVNIFGSYVIPHICSNCKFFENGCCTNIGTLLGKPLPIDEPFYRSCNEFKSSFESFKKFCDFLVSVGYANDLDS